MSGGTKHDQEKADISYVSWELVEQIAKVRAFGAKKYSRNNWKKGFKITRSCAAALRHIFQFLAGQTYDSESGECHLSHAVCCLEHAIYDMIHHPENDDRDIILDETGEVTSGDENVLKPNNQGSVRASPPRTDNAYGDYGAYLGRRAGSNDGRQASASNCYWCDQPLLGATFHGCNREQVARALTGVRDSNGSGSTEGTE